MPLAASARRELAALTARLTTLGYQDGVEDGVEEVVQEGFDKGFASGAREGWDAGLLYGGAAALAASLARDNDRRAREERPGAPSRSTDGAASTSTSTSTSTTAAREGGQPPATTPANARDAADGHEVGQTALGGSNEAGGLRGVVEELRRASLLGPDGPGVDREEVLRRLRLTGPAGAAVANRLAAEIR